MSSRCFVDFPREDGTRQPLGFAQPYAVRVADRPDEVIPLLRTIEQAAQEGSWAVGILAYEAALAFDPAFVAHPPRPGWPLAAFALFSAPDIIEHERQGFSCSPWQANVSREAFDDAVESIRRDIAGGLYYQANYTIRLSSVFAGDPWALFYALRKAQPGGYAFYMDNGDWQVASCSPELFFAFDATTRRIVTRPMKGTAATEAAAQDLAHSEKERAENLMIVDLLRNDLARIATHIQVPDLFTVHTLSTLLQMTSTITGQVRDGLGLEAIFAALFPCGSITGAPKIASMRAIKALETTPRGPYCGAFGLVEPGGSATFSVGIRCVSVMGSQALCGIGSGITWDSTPTQEYAEGEIKRRFLWRATATFDLLETLKLEEGHYWLLTRHLARLQRSAAHFGFPYTRDSLNARLEALAQAYPQGAYRVRLLLSRNGEIKTEIFVLEPILAPLRVILAQNPIKNDEFLRYKTTHRAIYEPFLPANPHVFDTILYNEKGEVTEFTRGNIALQIEGQLVTPPEVCGLLPGTLREDMLEKHILKERVIRIEDLPRATAMYFLNAVRGKVEVLREED